MSVEPQETVSVQVGDFNARAVKLFHGNIGPTAAWCESSYLCSDPVDGDTHGDCHIVLELADGTTEKVYPGDWVVKTDAGFKMYKDNQIQS